MGTELLEVGETYGRGFKRAVALAKRTVKNTPVEPEDLIEAMLRRMANAKTLVHVVKGQTFTFLDFIPPFPTRDEAKMLIEVPVPPEIMQNLMREREWVTLRAFQTLIEYERAGSEMPIVHYAPLNTKRLMAAGLRFWAATRTAGWKNPIGLKTPKTAAANKIVRKPRTVHPPVAKGGLPPLEGTGLYATKK